MFFTVKLHQARFQDAAIKDDGNDFGAFLNAAEVGQALRTANYCADLKVPCLRFARCFREPTTRDGERIARVARYMRWTADTACHDLASADCLGRATAHRVLG